MHRFLTYIGDLCVSCGVAIQKMQMMVCNVVLDEQNMDVLMNIRSVYPSICLFVSQSVYCSLLAVITHTPYFPFTLGVLQIHF